jgi:hypothetical protein
VFFGFRLFVNIFILKRENKRDNQEIGLYEHFSTHSIKPTLSFRIHGENLTLFKIPVKITYILNTELEKEKKKKKSSNPI